MDDAGATRAESVVFEVSGCELIDLDEFIELAEAGPGHGMAWAVSCVIAGLRPGIVAYLAIGGHRPADPSHLARLDLALQELNPSHDEPKSEPQPDSQRQIEPTTLGRFDIQADADLHAAVA